MRRTTGTYGPGRALRRSVVLAGAVALPVGVTACTDDDPARVMEPTIAELAATTPQLSTLAAALEAAGLTSTLAGEGPFTVFAPVDPAFQALGQDRIGRLLSSENRALLTKVLTYHVVPGEILASGLRDGATVATVEGSSLTFDLSGEPRVNGVRIIGTDIRASNGVVHLIEGVLTENLDIVDVATVEGFDALVEAVRAAGLEETLRTDNGGAGFTVFAPTDAAFSALGQVPSDPAVLSSILLYHGVGAQVFSTDLSDGQVVTTLQGGTFTVDLTSGVTLMGAQNDASVVAADVAASNGVIHVIDAVLLP